ncbi:hypothetical protein F5B21DRAFT_42281 [Xylaria acuta]|nr:hypothetical protein F5B21DRAFT_42281 [Xylaria acuta]
MNMHRYKTLLTFIFTLSAIFLNAALAAVDAPNNTLTLHSPRNENSGITPNSNITELDHRPENDEYHGSDNDFLEDDDDLEDEFDPHDIVYSTTQLNSTSSVLSRKKKALPVKDVTCSGLAAGRNITGAINAFVD